MLPVGHRRPATKQRGRRQSGAAGATAAGAKTGQRIGETGVQTQHLARVGAKRGKEGEVVVVVVAPVGQMGPVSGDGGGRRRAASAKWLKTEQGTQEQGSGRE